MLKIKMERTPHALITDGVFEHEQTLGYQKPFWVFFVGNLGVGTWLLGVFVAGMNLNFVQATLVLFAATFIGNIFPAATSMLGPSTRLSQMEAGRFSLGLTGKKIPAFLNWIGSIGWDVINNVLSATALSSLLKIYGLDVPFWLVLGVLVGLQALIGVYGHHFVQVTSKYSGILLAISFAIIGAVALYKMNGHVPVAKKASTGDIISAFLLYMVYNATSWTTYTADYTRYLPQKTPAIKVFLPVFGGLFLSFFLMAFLGYTTASFVTEQTAQGVIGALQGLAGSFAPLVLLMVAFNSIPINAINDNSSAYSLMSAGFKLSRPMAAVTGATLGYVICLFASSRLTEFYENFLFLFAHWMLPWVAIILTHWFVVGRKEQLAPKGITAGCIILIIVSALSIFLFSANTLYTGLLSPAIGGIDVGPYIGFLVAGLAYYVTLRAKAKK